MPLPRLHTSRLLLRPLQLDDAVAIQQVFPQWEIVRYLSAKVPWPYPPDGALSFVRDVALPGMAAGTHWCWTLRLLALPGELIGLVSLQEEPDNQRGFWLDPHYWGQGLMGEACAVVNRYWFQTLERPHLRVTKVIANEGSRRLSQREGMQQVACLEMDSVSGRLPAECWEITRMQWLARQR
ncbi:GNAT family N-acetyltransferase [Pseudomonas sp. EpS/L25]|uniref:GNAT family N-acetyltransferase n=1 Tax=Pseudomonas sp. EpS/L25 TaxID=1749078 RepID=UPI000743F603|nr:GNAT family N-acetyltransferase [Pseudomonas sp. EpS/L25]KUM42902.1 acetyltransferase [Pseudomonas sp. EpS/L25]